jgi:hypothetical protein
LVVLATGTSSDCQSVPLSAQAQESRASTTVVLERAQQVNSSRWQERTTTGFHPSRAQSDDKESIVIAVFVGLVLVIIPFNLKEDLELAESFLIFLHADCGGLHTASDCLALKKRTARWIDRR